MRRVNRAVAVVAVTLLAAGAAATAAASPRPSAGTSFRTAAGLRAPVVSEIPTSGSPTSTVAVSGAGFGADTAVGVFFDTTEEAVASTSGAGSFQAVLHVPGDATPGAHWITAVSQPGGRSAQQLFTVETNWSQQGFDPTHQAVNPFENVLTRQTVPHLQVNWRTTLPYPESGFVASPAVSHGSVYAGAFDGRMYAIREATGTVRWMVRTAGPIDSGPAVVNGTVYFGSEDHHIYALSANSGRRLWSYATGSDITAAPVVTGGVVYIGSTDGTFYALDAVTGQLRWSYTDANPQGPRAFDNGAAVANGVVYVGCGDGRIYALNAATGALLWSFLTKADYLIPGSPTVADGVVYVGADTGVFYALDADTGAPVWTYISGDGGVYTNPVVADGVVYVGGADAQMSALDAGTGARLWSFPTSDSTEQTYPALADGVLYYGTADNRLFALDSATGAELWTTLSPGYLDSPLVVTDGALFVGGSGGPTTRLTGVLYRFTLPSASLDKSPRPDPDTLRFTASS